VTTNPPPEPPEFNLDDYAREKLGGEPRLRAVGPDTPLSPELGAPIVINGRHLSELVDDIVAALVFTNDPPSLFVRAGRPTRIRADEHGRPIVEPCDAEHLRVAASDVCRFMRYTEKNGLTPAVVPLEILRAIMAAKSWPFPSLLGITEAPVLRPDGEFVTDAGYEPQTKLYHWSTSTYAPIPALPSAGEVAAAVQIIDDILADFPFDKPADRANAWGLLLTPLVRSIIDGQVPMALLDAPEPGTGKGLLAQVYTTIATGRPATMQPLPDNGEELDKRITSLLLAGVTNIVFDNVDGTISSHVLAAALTADTWGGRLLGQSVNIEVPNRATWLATGNNIDVGGDLARRCYRIRLDARQARPWAREGFRHPDLLEYVKRNRAGVLGALCTIIRSWHCNGRPMAKTISAMGGYTSWVRTVGGILGHIGVDEFLGNLSEFHATADHEASSWEAFLTAWQEHWTDGTSVTVGDLVRSMEASDSTIREALPDQLSGLWGDKRFPARLGMQLRKRAGRRYGDSGVHVVIGPKSRANVTTYSVAAAPYAQGLSQVHARGDAVTSTNVDTAGTAGTQPPYPTGGVGITQCGYGEIAPAVPAVPAVPAPVDPLEEPF
jgi:hypothetical protein